MMSPSMSAGGSAGVGQDRVAVFSTHGGPIGLTSWDAAMRATLDGLRAAGLALAQTYSAASTVSPGGSSTLVAASGAGASSSERRGCVIPITRRNDS